MNDQMKQRLEDRIKVTNTPELQVLLCDCRTLIEELEGEVKSWAEQAEQYRLLIPTTAQAMAYQSLLNKYNQLEQQLLERDAACAAMRNAAIEALYRLADGASGQKHDPSWTRPVTLTRQEIQDTCIQAYHWMHKVKEVGAGRDLLERLQKAEAELKAWVETKQNKPSE